MTFGERDQASLEVLVDAKLRQSLGPDVIERGLSVLREANLVVRDALLDASQAQDNLDTIVQDAEAGTLTVIDSNGRKLVLISVDKLFDVAEQSRRKLTVGDMLDAYPGVDATDIPRVSNRGRPARQLDLPPGEPAD